MVGFSRRPKESAPLKLAIYDDLFPYIVSGFRLAELQSYLELDSRIEICTTLSSLGWLGVNQTKREVVKEWKKSSGKDFARQVRVIESGKDIPQAHAIYSIFLNNIYDVIDEIESRNISFAFTLYPGGGFALHDENSDLKLERVLRSPNLFKAIVTQPVTLDYLKEKFPYSLEKVEYIFGGVLPSSGVLVTRKSSGDLRIVFCANKYHPQGLDKGFDLFVDAMNKLADLEVKFSAHIIGPWHSEDIDYASRRKHFIFHGVVASTELQSMLSNFDLAVFPTRSNELGNGTFDGFPTGSAIEAGLAGCVVLTTNPLNQKCPLVPDADYFVIEACTNSIVDRILNLAGGDRNTLDSFRLHSSHAFSKMFSLETQMQPRINLVNELIQRSTYGL